MIVFTATNKETRDVYVGTARESVEEEWADLNAQAENGASGQFFNQLRDQGAAGFEVDTWAYGESASEARESMREAREELGAMPIKSSRTKAAVVRKPVNERSDSMKALMAVFQEAMTDDSSSDDEPFETVASEGKQKADNNQASEAVVAESAASSSPEVKAAASDTAAAKAPESVAPVQSEEQRMAARVEAMKAAQAKLLRERGQSSGKTAKPAAPEKIASGRTGSTAKEKRIREAIEAERERRESVRQTRGRDEYDEMSAVMARVEMRRLATKRSNAEKTKAAAAKKRKEEREKKARLAAPEVSPLRVEVKAEKAPTADVEPAKKAKPAVATKASRAAAKAKVAELKLAVGRTGSSAKEKRIKEAIAQEKAERVSKGSSQSPAEAEEMAAILARLDERGKVAEKLKRSR